MEIETEMVVVAPSVAKQTGRSIQKVYYLAHGGRKIGPYPRYGDALIAHHRVTKVMQSRSVVDSTPDVVL